jgi:hypothetical protein
MGLVKRTGKRASVRAPALCWNWGMGGDFFRVSCDCALEVGGFQNTPKAPLKTDRSADRSAGRILEIKKRPEITGRLSRIRKRDPRVTFRLIECASPTTLTHSRSGWPPLGLACKKYPVARTLPATIPRCPRPPRGILFGRRNTTRRSSRARPIWKHNNEHGSSDPQP